MIQIKNFFITHNEKLNIYLYIPFLTFASLQIFYILGNTRFAGIPQFMGYLFSFILVYILYIFFSAICGNNARGVAVIAYIFTILFAVSQIKVAYSDDPLFLSDVLFLGAGDTLFELVGNTLPIVILRNSPVIIGMALAFYGTYKLAKKHKATYPKIGKRVCVSASSLLLIVFLFLPLTSVNAFMLNVFFGAQGRQDNYATSNMMYYFKSGVTAGLYGLELENRLVKPDEYDKSALAATLTEAESTAEKTLGKPNIIVVFSESFWNIDVLDEIKFDKKICENFEELSKSGSLYEMISPSYGGISSNVEFEFLTGGSTKFFNKGYIPYMQLYKNDEYFNSPSVINELNKNGYTTAVFSTWKSTLFNSKKVYSYFGVDNVKFEEDYVNTAKKGGRISDDSAASEIIDYANANISGDPFFCMTMTAQAHMPYKKDKYEKYDINITQSNLSEEKNMTVRAYAQGIYDADKQLKRLYDYIQTLSEPTILIFYGDHLPYLKLNGNGENILNSLEYFNTDDERLNLYRRYHTQCLVTANYEFEQEKKILGVDLIMARLMDRMDIQLSDYYVWLNTTTEMLPASNHTVSADSNGNLYFTKKLEGEMKNTFDMREKMNWMFFVK